MGISRLVRHFGIETSVVCNIDGVDLVSIRKRIETSCRVKFRAVRFFSSMVGGKAVGICLLASVFCAACWAFLPRIAIRDSCVSLGLMIGRRLASFRCLCDVEDRGALIFTDTVVGWQTG